jgi:hypothetical protein
MNDEARTGSAMEEPPQARALRLLSFITARHTSLTRGQGGD